MNGLRLFVGLPALLCIMACAEDNTVNQDATTETSYTIVMEGGIAGIANTRSVTIAADALSRLGDLSGTILDTAVLEKLAASTAASTAPDTMTYEILIKREPGGDRKFRLMEQALSSEQLDMLDQLLHADN